MFLSLNDTCSCPFKYIRKAKLPQSEQVVSYKRILPENQLRDTYRLSSISWDSWDTTWTNHGRTNWTSLPL